ncbi:uncharacterized protein FOMMEDRAFT_154259 [Fomitiporia mediterranea MF3/22]|uniref:uncharacterized protein n=1 Tax=Fomitiporia mediterranea (strain MF3/22) TaxID=694068 RepID=UPI0004409336|nr:uncharacterized protein FOMMEDRAFT_154259 [Fomitiporia mediterranea MF3/22]EJD05083.1 hypothetical protein FOMMEDRAFT_154259 [Fomitiporia mediterranea MF3/22]
MPLEPPYDSTHRFQNSSPTQYPANVGELVPNVYQQQQSNALPPLRTVCSRRALHSQRPPSDSPTFQPLLVPRNVSHNRNSAPTTSSDPGLSFPDHHIELDQGESLHDVLSKPMFHGPHTQHLENPCHCNNIICTLFGSNHPVMNEPATRARYSRIHVVLGPFSFYVDGRKSSRTGGLKPVSVRELLNAIHERLHMQLSGLFPVHFPLEQRPTIVTQMIQHATHRTGCKLDYVRAPPRLLVDFIQRNNFDITSPAMYLKRLQSDPATFKVGLV